VTVVSRAPPEALQERERLPVPKEPWSEAVLPVVGGAAAVLAALTLAVCVAVAPTLTVLGLALVVIALLARGAPPFAISGVIFLFGVEGTIKVRLGQELPSLPVTPKALGAAVIDLAFLIAFLGVVREDRGRSLVAIWRNMGRGARTAIVALAAWLALSVLQIRVSGNLGTGLSGFRLTQAYVLAVPAGAMLFAKRRSERLLLALLGVLFVVSAYAAVRAVVGPSPGERVAAFGRQTTALVPTSHGVIFRNVGSFSSAIGLVSFLAPAGVFLFALGLLFLRYRLAAWLTVALSFVAVVGAYIRTSLVALALGVLSAGTLLIFGGDLARRTKILFAIVTVPLVVSLLGLGVLATNLAGRGSSQREARSSGLLHPLADPSLQQRFRTWRESMHVVKAHPLGTGVGTVGRATLTQQGSITVTDNSYLKVLREQGWPGGLLFALGVLGTWTAAAIRLMKVGTRVRPIGAAALAGSLTFFLLALDSEAIEQPGKVVAWTLLGIALWEAYGPTRSQTNAP
jgi:hypothetical protein